ncbi:MAG: hypothetical protein H8E26_06920 [FCB group bacterium]|nr:hypothetical protein [FCB group bacterium]MBL7029526.1 hypothetical protein [Candidatus Neomarinimicrobiota bacterium]MBL7121852.1 hypothetical protein [Candidatus Neomarinimicrobiota bacterium]
MGDIDLKNAESRTKYLKDNLGSLMNGIDSNYGQVLMDELMRRMEATVSEFNDEVKAMLGQLQGIKPTPKDNILTSAPRPEPQAPQAPKAAPAPQAAPAPPTTELKSAPPIIEPEPVVELPSFSDEPETFAAPPEPPPASETVKEVEIEVDLPPEELSDFEKKLRSLGS